MVKIAQMSNNQKEIFAIRGKFKRPATAEEIKSTETFFASSPSQSNKFGILFIHGLTGNPAIFQNYARSFVREGYTVSVPLLPGHGTNPADLMKASWKQWKKKVFESYDELKAQCSKVFVIAISLGGTLALQLALERPEIGKLFLIAPSVYLNLQNWITVYILYPIFRHSPLRYWFNISGDIKNPEGLELAYSKIPVKTAKDVTEICLDTQKLLPAIQQDILIFQSEEDHIVPAHRVRDIIKNLGSKKKELIFLKDSYHLIPLDNDSERVLNRIQKDIRALTGQTAR